MLDIYKLWYALYTKPRQEFKAELQLSAIGIETYLPTITSLRQWSDRKKRVTLPLLPGYIFIKVDNQERAKALEQPSIVRCVYDRGKPAIIHEFQIQNLKNFIKEEAEYRILQGLVKGNKVIIKDGPFKGVIGILMEDSDGKSLAVSIELLNRTIITHITDLKLVEVYREIEMEK